MGPITAAILCNAHALIRELLGRCAPKVLGRENFIWIGIIPRITPGKIRAGGFPWRSPACANFFSCNRDPGAGFTVCHWEDMLPAFDVTDTVCAAEGNRLLRYIHTCKADLITADPCRRDKLYRSSGLIVFIVCSIAFFEPPRLILQTLRKLRAMSHPSSFY